MAKQQPSYSKEFKQEAVRLVETSSKGKSAVARDLDISLLFERLVLSQELERERRVLEPLMKKQGLEREQRALELLMKKTEEEA